MISKFASVAVLTVAMIFVVSVAPVHAWNVSPVPSDATNAHVVVLHQQPQRLPQVLGQACGPRYTVRRGDTLAAIARRCGVGLTALVRANRLRSANFIRAGQVLVIPGGNPPPPARRTPQPLKQTVPRVPADKPPAVQEAPPAEPPPTPSIEPTIADW